MASANLDLAYSGIIELLQTNDSFRIAREHIVAPPSELHSNALVFRRSHHDYGMFRVDAIHGYGQKEAWCSLGLTVLASVLHAKETVVVRLTNEHSEIRSILISGTGQIDHEALDQHAVAYRYVRRKPAKHPWYQDFRLQRDRTQLPFIELSAEPEPVSDEQRARRDLLRGFGAPEAAARLAQLLLDISHPSAEVLEIALEQEPGFAGVAPGSAELLIWLPGSFGWEESFFE